MTTLFFRNNSNTFAPLFEVTFVAPGTVNFVAVGAGGGGGGSDAGIDGQDGSDGERIDGTFRVSAGTKILLQCGAGGMPGSSNSTGTGKGRLGKGLIHGASGGQPGRNGSSGGGGGGGAASFIVSAGARDIISNPYSILLLNSMIYAIAAGGGGGAGAGVQGGQYTRNADKRGTFVSGTGNYTGADPSAGSSNTSDGGGGGGGGGGWRGGQGGDSFGDVIAQGGSIGQSFVGTLAQSTSPHAFNISDSGKGGRGSGSYQSVVYDSVPIYKTRNETALDPCTDPIYTDDLAGYRYSYIKNGDGSVINGIYLYSYTITSQYSSEVSTVVSKYRSRLNRTPEPEGLQFWVYRLMQEPSTFDSAFNASCAAEDAKGNVKIQLSYCTANPTYSIKEVQYIDGYESVPRNVTNYYNAEQGRGGYIVLDYTIDDPNFSEVSVKVGGNMRKSNSIKIRQGNSWRDVGSAYVRHNDQWVKVYEYVDPATLQPQQATITLAEPFYSFTSTGDPLYPIVACGQSANGGGSANYTLDLGTATSGTVRIPYSFYGVQDDIIVEYAGASYRTGYISGSGTITFTKTSERYATLYVNRFGANPGTGWEFAVNCP